MQYFESETEKQNYITGFKYEKDHYLVRRARGEKYKSHESRDYLLNQMKQQVEQANVSSLGDTCFKTICLGGITAALGVSAGMLANMGCIIAGAACAIGAGATLIGAIASARYNTKLAQYKWFALNQGKINETICRAVTSDFDVRNSSYVMNMNLTQIEKVQALIERDGELNLNNVTPNLIHGLFSSKQEYNREHFKASQSLGNDTQTASQYFRSTIRRLQSNAKAG